MKSSTTKSRTNGGRTRPKLSAAPDNYFTSEKVGLSFISSGCTLLDCALGGGWCLGRVVNVVGDRSTAKTGLAIEALINFLLAHPEGRAAYRETEAAFDKGYAEAMGLPIREIDFGGDSQLNTVEDFARDFSLFLDDRIKAKQPGIYVLDSLDALSDEAEMDRDIGKGSYQMEKAKMLSTFFRKTASKMEKSQALLMIVSQVRDAIGVTFGDRSRRSGGRALDFYASQVAWIRHIETITRTINKVNRPIGIALRAKIKKNKVGLPFREADFNFMFGYGIQDAEASTAWLESVGREIPKGADLKSLVKQTWAEIETTFLPAVKKYG